MDPPPTVLAFGKEKKRLFHPTFSPKAKMWGEKEKKYRAAEGEKAT